MTLRHSALATLVALIWGLNFVVIDQGLEGFPPFLFLALRFLLVSIPAVFFIPRPDVGWSVILTVGAFLSLGQFTFPYLALHLGMPAGLASLVLQAQVMLTVILAAGVLGERPSRRQVIGVVVGMLGLMLVISAHGMSAPLIPVFVTLLAATSWAIGNVLSRRSKVASGLGLVVWSGLVVPIPAAALSLLIDGPDEVQRALTHISTAAVLSTLYTAIFASLVGYGIWNSLMAKYPTSSVVPFTLLVPVVGIAAAWAFQDEVPARAEIWGGVIMLAGLAVATIAWERSRKGRAIDSPREPSTTSAS
ncbi:O-acetylserine/cysteine exporter [soil metagenome]